MTTTTNLWLAEYLKKGIPSSFRETPSHSVLWFEEYLRSHGKKQGKLLDLGAGKGRNALQLKKNGFSLSCLDMVEANIQAIREKAPDIDARCHDLAKPFPYPDNNFDYAIDIFCFKHIIDAKAIQNYLSELKRVLKKGAIYHLSLASVQDGYYGPLMKGSRHIVDPATQIPSILYSRTDVENLFEGFELLEFFEKKNLGPMHGKAYVRCILSFIFEVK
jgi:ubiquinone/menaquinone biosynthesis C-methylase UbiE